MQKKQIRTSCLALRNEMPKNEVDEKSYAISQRLLHSAWFQNYDTFFVYHALGNEVDLSYFIEECFKNKKNVFFPRVHGMDMDFYQVTAWDQLTKGYFGIMEPDINSCEKFTFNEKVEEHDKAYVMLVPGVAFSKNNQRIGYGKGFYDRFLNQKSYRELFFLIGIQYDNLILDEWIRDPFDVNMDIVFSEKER